MNIGSTFYGLAAGIFLGEGLTFLAQDNTPLGIMLLAWAAGAILFGLNWSRLTGWVVE